MNRTRLRLMLVCSITLVGLGACGGGDPDPDGGGDDAGPRDGGGGRDAQTVDALVPLDAPLADDAGDLPDASTVDAAMPDGGGLPTPSELVQAVRDASPGTLPSALGVESLVVTYVRPAIGSDPAGFFVQPDADGPALFVAVDPSDASLGGITPAPGDTVAFDVTSTAVTDGQLRVTGVSGFTRSATGADPSTLAQDVSALDLPAMLDAHESELVRVTATVAGAFTGCSAPHRCAQITTAGFGTAGTSYRLRTTSDIESALGLRAGCVLDVGPTPLWRFNTSAQPSAWDASEIVVTSCPALPAPAAGEVVITEIAHAFAGSDGEREWLELYNPSTSASYELMGCTIEDSAAAPHTIAASLVIGPGAHVVLAGPMADLVADYALPASIFGLSDTGDLLTLRCGTPAVVVDTVDWRATAPGAPFPGAVDDATIQVGPGARDATMNDDGSNWCVAPASATYGTGGALRGSPGAANPTCPAATGTAPSAAGQIVITEMMPNPAVGNDDDNEWFELHNPSTTVTYQLAGCTIADSASAPHAIATSLEIAPGGYALLARGSGAAWGYTGIAVAYHYGSAFSLNNSGTDGVTLACGGTTIDDVTYVSTSWPMGAGIAANLSPALLDAVANDSASAWCAATATIGASTDTGTPGAANTACP